MTATLAELHAALNFAAEAGIATPPTGSIPQYLVDPTNPDGDGFGLVLVTTDGQEHGVGDYRRPFSAQSITKLFALALVLAEDGDALWKRVGHDATARPYNSLAQLELNGGTPENPFVNAGALVITDRLCELTGDAAHAVANLIQSESGSAINIDASVAAAERVHLHRNTALAHLLADFEALRNPAELVLEQYVNQCALSASCLDLARAGMFLAREGNLHTGSRLLTRSQAKQINAITLLAGMYDGMAEAAYRIGLPAKSGVGGGVLAIIPNRGALCAWSPRLDHRGNSIAATAALEEFTTITGLSIF